MIGYGLGRGERLTRWQTLGLTVALAGFVYLVLPGLAAPPLRPALLVRLGACISLRGQGSHDPVAASAGNFVRAAPLAVSLSLLVLLLPGAELQPDGQGIFYASLSGAVTSGLGYVIWYTVLPSLPAVGAATVQLSVPILAAVGGVVAIGEPITLRLTLASIAILGGIALVLRAR